MGTTYSRRNAGTKRNQNVPEQRQKHHCCCIKSHKPFQNNRYEFKDLLRKYGRERFLLIKSAIFRHDKPSDAYEPKFQNDIIKDTRSSSTSEQSKTEDEHVIQSPSIAVATVV